MIIKQVHIFNYGKWHDATIPFKQGLNILYGSNEAGKTTLISFIKGVLFGYLQPRSSHKNYIPRASKNYGGQLEIVSGPNHYIVQRMAGKKGGRLTVLNLKGHRVDNSVLSKILGPFDRDTFNALYYFGTVNLQAMGKLKQKDLIYRIQRIGLAHSDEWIDYRENLEKQAKKLYSPRGYKPPLNQALKEYDRLVDQAKAAKSGYQDYLNLLGKIRTLKHRQSDVTTQIKQVNYQNNQLKRDQDTWLRYQKVQHLKPWMAHKLKQGFMQTDLNQLRELKNKLTDVSNQFKLTQQRIHQYEGQKIVDSGTTIYNHQRTKINQLADQFNPVQQRIHDLSLLKDRIKDVDNQLAPLKAQYTVNQQILSPLAKLDLRAAKNLRIRYQTNQQQIPALNRELIQRQSNRSLNAKDYAVSGVSLLLMIAGIIIKFWLLAGLGAVILILNVVYTVYKARHQHVQQIQTKLSRLKNDDSAILQNLQSVQKKYRYRESSVDSWLASQNNLRELRKLLDDVRKLRQQKDQLSQTIHAYFAKWSFMNRQLTLSSDDANRLLQLKNYVSKMERIHKVNHDAGQQSRRASKVLAGLKSKQNRVKKGLSAFYQARQIRDATEFTKAQQRQLEIKQKQNEYRQLSQQIGASELQALKQYATLDELKATENEVNHHFMELKSRSQKITSQLTADRVKLQQMVHNGSYDELQQRIANYQTQINELAKQWLEESLASQWINATLNLATKGRVPKIEHQAQVNFQILTNHHYVSIIFNKSKIKVMRKDKKRFTLYEISKGTVQQLYLALVFAMAQVFSSDYPMPVLIDDGFTDFDVDRRQAAIKLLKVISKHLQVIYCTSDHSLVNQSGTLNLNQIK